MGVFASQDAVMAQQRRTARILRGRQAGPSSAPPQARSAPSESLATHLFDHMGSLQDHALPGAILILKSYMCQQLEHAHCLFASPFTYASDVHLSVSR